MESTSKIKSLAELVDEGLIDPVGTAKVRANEGFLIITEVYLNLALERRLITEEDAYKIKAIALENQSKLINST